MPATPSGASLDKLGSGGGRLVEDKLVTAERYAACNVATAPILAVVGRNEIAHPHEGRFPALKEAHEVIDLLRGAPAALEPSQLREHRPRWWWRRFPGLLRTIAAYRGTQDWSECARM